MKFAERPHRIRRPGRALLALLCTLPSPVAPAVITVAGGCTLVNAITAANTDTAVGSCDAGSGTDEIRLTSDVVLTAVDNATFGDNGLPSIVSDIIVEGNGYSIERSAQAGTPPFRFFHVASGATLSLNAVRLANGYVPLSFPAAGAIRNHGTVNLTNSTLTENSAAWVSGAVQNLGTLNISGSTISNNTAEGSSGGISNSGFATISDSTIAGNSAYDAGGITNGGMITLTRTILSGNSADEGFGGGMSNRGWARLTECVVSGNSAWAAGGGIENTGDLIVTGSTFVENSAVALGALGGGLLNAATATLDGCTFSDNSSGGSGGGIYNWRFANLDLTNCTISRNSAFFGGGGLYNEEWAYLRNCTFYGNSAQFGGGIALQTSLTFLSHTIVANSSGENCHEDIIDFGNNLADDASCGIPDTLSGVDPVVADNGGPAMTHALLEGSSAIDAGTPAVCPETDQRGAPRIGPCDIGAFEYIPCPDLVLSSEIISGTETRENCQTIVVGPDCSVASSGDLTLRAGKAIVLGDTTSVASDGRLTLEIVPDLQLVPP